MRDCLALLESFDYENDEDSQSKAFFNAHINADWFFHVKHSIERQLEAKVATQSAPTNPSGDELRKIARSARTSASAATPAEYVLAGWRAALAAQGGE